MSAHCLCHDFVQEQEQSGEPRRREPQKTRGSYSNPHREEIAKQRSESETDNKGREYGYHQVGKERRTSKNEALDPGLVFVRNGQKKSVL